MSTTHPLTIAVTANRARPMAHFSLPSRMSCHAQHAAKLRSHLDMRKGLPATLTPHRPSGPSLRGRPHLVRRAPSAQHTDTDAKHRLAPARDTSDYCERAGEPANNVVNSDGSTTAARTQVRGRTGGSRRPRRAPYLRISPRPPPRYSPARLDTRNGTAYDVNAAQAPRTLFRAPNILGTPLPLTHLTNTDRHPARRTSHRAPSRCRSPRGCHH